jgi:hypothetical protein
VHPQLDLPVLLAGIGATGIVALVAGLLPALKAWRTDVRYLLTSQGMTASPRWRAHRLAIFVQVLISSALLVLAAWNLNHLLSTELHGAGFSVENTVIGELDFSMQRYPPERALARLESLRTRLRSVAGVTGVEIATGLPFGTRMLRGTVAAGRGDLVPGTASLSVGVIATTPGYFAALRLPVLAGQVPSTDVDDEVWSVLINESTSESVFGTPAGLGRELSVRVQSLTAGRYLTNRARVVGIVPDTDVGGLGRREDGMIYLAYHDHYEPFAAVVVSHAAGARGVADAMRAAVREIDPDLVLLRVQTGRDLLDDQSLIVRFVAGVTLGLGGLALFLALTGLCSIMLHSTALRRRELGIRAAMGASAPTLARMLVGDNTRVLIPGILAGAALGHWAGSLLSRIRWVGVEPNSLLSFVGVPALVFGLAIVACLLLATRAARVHPAEALRHL